MPLVARPSRTALPSSPVHGVALLFDAGPANVNAQAVDTRNPKWIQICAEGEYRGYRNSSRAFVMDRACFSKMVENLHRHPSYVPDAPKMPPADVAAAVMAGELGVVPFDVDHGHGPAEAWSLDLDVRQDAKGKWGLWSFTYFLEPAYTWMVQAKYKWTSIEWEENGTDPVSGEKVGPLLLAVALTNNPFVEGMSAIQAQRFAALAVERRAAGEAVCFGYAYDPSEPPGDAVEVVCALRSVLDQPDISSLGEVMAGVANLRAWASGTSPVPPGVDIARKLRELRRLLALKPLDEPATIWAELDKLLGRLADEEEMKTVMPTPPTATPTPEPSALTRRVAAYLTRFHRAAAPAAPALPEQEEVVTLEFERFAGRADEAFALVESCKRIFGTEDPKVLGEKFAALMGVQAQLADIVPDMVDAAAAEEVAADQMAAADVVAAMSARGMNPDDPSTKPIREALMLQRVGLSKPEKPPTREQVAADPKLFSAYLAGVKQRRALREQNRTEFRAKHELDRGIPVPPQFQNLYGAFFTGQNPAFGPINGGAQPTQFAQQQGGAPPPPAPGVFSWARIAQLPPSQNGDNESQRVFDELVRTEFAGKRPDQQTTAHLWKRVLRIMSDVTAREGAPPPNLLRAAN